MKILLLSPLAVDRYPPVQYQAILLARAGHQVTLLTAPIPGRKSVEFSCAKAKIVSALAPSGSRMLQSRGFVAAMLRCRLRSPDLEIAYDTTGVFFSQMCPWKPPTRVAHLHETLLDPASRPSERFVIKYLSRFSRVVCADRNRAKLLQEQLGLAFTPEFIPNFPLRNDAALQPRSYAEEFTVTYTGSLGTDQSLDTILYAIAQLPKVRLKLIGGGGNRSTLERIQGLTRELNIVDRVDHVVDLPRMSDVLEELMSCHLGVAILRPIYDQWRFASDASNKRYQYMQAGLPQVSDMNMGVPELIEANGIGKCVEPDRPDELAAAIAFYRDNPEIRVQAGRRALELHLTRFNYEKAFQPTLDWLDSL